MENQARATLLKKARETTTSPGVYLMRDAAGALLYVGKAKNLRNRISTYFQAQPHATPRTEMLVNRICDFEIILTETESEALILECSLIKKHKPKFNVLLKDDKTYPYIKIQINEPYPRLEWTRRVNRDGARYFGPFTSGWAAKQVMVLLNKTFKLRDCSDNSFRNRSRPCILFQMGQCSGSCVEEVTQEEYRHSIEQVIDVLEGRGSGFVKQLRKSMTTAAQNEEFELAAEYRDQLQNLEVVTQTQVAEEAGEFRSRDVIGLARKDGEAHGVILQIRSGRMLSVKHYHLENTDPTLSDEEVLFDFLAQVHAAHEDLKKKHEDAEQVMPGVQLTAAEELLLPVCPEDSELLERTIGARIRTSRSEKEKQLLNVARTNAQYALEQKLRKAAAHGIQALEDVQEKLHLDRLPRRIECYDISNIHGQDAVASRVVFMDGGPDKNLYRRYKIRTVEGSNDFAMMKEVLDRRFSNTDEALPDLVVVDGGKGQLSQAVAILQELGVQGVQAVGLAKARTESDFESSEVKASHERIFIPGRKNPVALLPHTQAYKLLVHVRDEAHRFAVSYHRLLRSKRSLHTEKKSGKTR